MAWSLPCPECGTQNEPDGSGAVLCSTCGRFYRAPQGGVRDPSLDAVTSPGVAVPALMRAAQYGGMGEIEAHLTELGIPFQRVSDTSIQVVRQLGPQTVNLTIDSARNIHIHSASGVQDVTLADSASTRLYFDPNWKERYDFDLALEDKTFALINTATSDLPEVPDDLPPPPFPAPATPAPLAAPPAPEVATQPNVLPVGLSLSGSSMAEALGNVPPPPARPEAATISAAPVARPLRGDEDQRTPLPVPAVILPATPDGRPPVLAPTPPAPAAVSLPPAPAAPDGPLRRPSGVFVTNGASRDVIEHPISARVEREDTPPPVSLKRALTPPSRPAIDAEPRPLTDPGRAALGRTHTPSDPMRPVLGDAAMPKAPTDPGLRTPVGARQTPSEPMRAALGDPAMPKAPTDPGRVPVGALRTPSDPMRVALGDPAAPRTPTDPSSRQPVPRTPTDPSRPALGDAPRSPTDPSQRALGPRVPTGPRPSLDPPPRTDEPATVPDVPRPEVDVSALETVTAQVVRPVRDRRPEREEARYDERPEDEVPRARLGAGWTLIIGLVAGLAVGTLVDAPAALLEAIRPAAARVREGNAAVRRGDLDAAVARFQEAVKLDPRSAVAWRNLGAAYALRGDQVQSTEAYRKYLELAGSPEEARAVRELLGEK